MHRNWKNWSGSVTCRPSHWISARSQQEVVRAVGLAAEKKLHLRTLGAGHSSSDLVPSNQLLLDLEGWKGLIGHDPIRSRARLRTGMTVGEVGEACHQVGLALHNTGDVDVQTLAGAISTGTHGSGHKLKNLSSILVGATLVDGQGQVQRKSQEQDPEFFQALRVSLGCLGILTEVEVQLMPSYRLRRREWCTNADRALPHLAELIERHRNFDFYWYPRSDEIKLRTLDEPPHTPEVTFARCVQDETDWSYKALPRNRTLRFEEMEYALPAEAGPACFEELRLQIKKKYRKHVGWRLLYRTVAADDVWLSPAHGRPTVTISLHHNNTLPYRPFFDALEPVFLTHGGRPHWGKKHNLSGSHLAALYPQWNRFLEVRRQMDPTGVFLSPALKQLLGVTS